MLQTLLEEVSDVNGIGNAVKEGFTFIESGFTSEGVQGRSKMSLEERNYFAREILLPSGKMKALQ